MNQLVYIENGKTVTDSLTVAEVFGKTHRRVMQDIRELGCSDIFREHHFVLSSYKTSQQKNVAKYIITQDGFSFLAMSYTGAAADKFKEKYIQEFNRMQTELNKRSSDPVKALMQATHNLLTSQEIIAARLEDVEQKVESQITLDSGQQRRLQQAINRKVCSIEPDGAERPELFRQIHKEIKDRWQVPSYKDVLRQDLQSALNYIDAWVPIRRNA